MLDETQDTVDIFNMNNVEFEYTKESTNDSMYFSPNPINYKGSNGLYKATIRFIPFWKNPAKSKIHKEVAYLTDPYTQEKKTIDSYKSLGKSEAKRCPIMKHYWWLYKHSDATYQAKTALFKQSKRYYALVQILDDEINPQNVGKILIWNFGTKVNDKFMAESEDTKRGSKIIPGVSPFKLLDGNPMEVVVSLNGDYPNYDKCEFFQCQDGDEFGSPIYPIKYDSNGGVTEWGHVSRNDKNSQKLFQDYVKESSPDLVEYCDFKEWDNDTKEFVQRCIDASKGEYNNSDNYMDSDDDVIVSNKIKNTKTAPQVKSTPTKKTKTAVIDKEIDDIMVDDDDDLNLDDFDLDDDFGDEI